LIIANNTVYINITQLDYPGTFVTTIYSIVTRHDMTSCKMNELPPVKKITHWLWKYHNI